MRMATKLAFALAMGTFAPTLAWSHAHLISPVPRNAVANKTPAGVTAPPGDSCGTDPAGVAGNLVTRDPSQTKTLLQPGQSLTVQFTETIDHVGHYQLWLSPNADDSAMTLLLDNIPDVQGGTLPHMYTATVTIPANVTCTDCTLRLIQVMLDVPATPSYYYSCANVQIGGQLIAPAPAPSPSPSVTPCK